MLVPMYKAFRFRVYPTKLQLARLTEWEHAARFLWNLAHAQRLAGLARCGKDKRYPTAFDQINELTQLRNECPWLADAPRSAQTQLLLELDLAWQSCFKTLAARPNFRKRSSCISICEPNPRSFHLIGQHSISFPKLGSLEIVVHRALEGRPKTCRLVREVDQWFAVITCEVETAEPQPRTEPCVALDRGVCNIVADSEGHLTPSPRHLERSLRRIARAQRVVARRKRGSKNQTKARIRVAKLHRKVRRQRNHLLHGISHDYAKSHGTVVVEKLAVQRMTRSASGTVEAPGRNVAQKAGLNRGILDAGWSRLHWMLGYKLAWSGGQLVEVPAAYSSQTCSKCGHVDAASRVSQAVFRCTDCGHTEHADVNAAKALLSRRSDGVAVCGGSAVGRPAKQKLRVVRRGQRRNIGAEHGGYKASVR